VADFGSGAKHACGFELPGQQRVIARLRPKQVFESADRQFAGAENAKKHGVLRGQEFLLGETPVARVNERMDSESATLGIGQTDARKIRLHDLADTAVTAFKRSLISRFETASVVKSRSSCSRSFCERKLSLGALQLQVHRREFGCPLHDADLQIVARPGEQSFCTPTRGTEPAHEDAEHSVDNQVGLRSRVADGDGNREIAPRRVGEQESEQPGPVPAYQTVMAIAAKENEVKGCGKW